MILVDGLTESKHKWMVLQSKWMVLQSQNISGRVKTSKHKWKSQNISGCSYRGKTHLLFKGSNNTDNIKSKLNKSIEWLIKTTFS